MHKAVHSSRRTGRETRAKALKRLEGVSRDHAPRFLPSPHAFFQPHPWSPFHPFTGLRHVSARHGDGHVFDRIWRFLTNPCLDDLALALVVIAAFAAIYYLCGLLPHPHPWTNPDGWIKNY